METNLIGKQVDVIVPALQREWGGVVIGAVEVETKGGERSIELFVAQTTSLASEGLAYPKLHVHRVPITNVVCIRD